MIIPAAYAAGIFFLSEPLCDYQDDPKCFFKERALPTGCSALNAVIYFVIPQTGERLRKRR